MCKAICDQMVLPHNISNIHSVTVLSVIFTVYTVQWIDKGIPASHMLQITTQNTKYRSLIHNQIILVVFLNTWRISITFSSSSSSLFYILVLVIYFIIVVIIIYSFYIVDIITILFIVGSVRQIEV